MTAFRRDAPADDHSAPRGSRIRPAFAALALVAGCDQSDRQAPVDTTIPEPRPATLSGELSYPSDYIPEDMRVCAESLSSGLSHCGARFDHSGRRRLYRLSVPAGRYRVYALTAETPNYRAYYTDAVPCGLSVECTSHKPIAVDVEAGETKEGIDPADWYAGN